MNTDKYTDLNFTYKKGACAPFSNVGEYFIIHPQPLWTSKKVSYQPRLQDLYFGFET
ncbi:hypothetical protein PLUTE_a4466 [Pseudoalteromonas luteoviolacea DSM 6061]|nr:hypothetical protein [Pseudoalteromonas luteoviolacea DSM 6061]